jgi:hypothetical protein
MSAANVMWHLIKPDPANTMRNTHQEFERRVVAAGALSQERLWFWD